MKNASIRRFDSVDAVPVAPPRTCRTIAVTSGKGGVGKSNLVANLSIGISRLGKSVMVMDADLGLANLDVLFGVRPQHTLYHVLKGKKDLLDIIISGAPGVKFIAGGSGMRELADMDGPQRGIILEKLQALESYTDVFLIDTGAGLSQNVMSFVIEADEVLVVTTPEPTAMADAYGIIKAIHAEAPRFPTVSIIVNRVKTPEEGSLVAGRMIKVAKQFLEVDVAYAGYVLDDRNVVRAVRAQKPFMNLYPHTYASACVSSIVSRMFGVENRRTQTPPQGITGMIKRWMGMAGA